MTTPTQTTFLYDFFSKNKVNSILDIGANCGIFSLECKNINPNLDILMIEGNPNCQDILKNTQLRYHIALLSDIEKEVIFYLNRNNSICTGSSYYKEITKHYNDSIEIVLNTIRLDDLVFGEVFDFIKIDTQGSEYDVIFGGLKTFSNASWVLCECPYTESSDIPQYNSGCSSFDKIFDLLKTIGFNNYEVIEELRAYDEVNSPYREGTIFAKDVLFYK